MGGTLMPKMWGEIGAREKLSAPWAIPGSTATSTWPTDFRWGRFNFDTDVERTDADGPRRLSSGGRTNDLSECARQEIAVQDEH